MQPTANPDRGEHTLLLAGTRYRLRPSFTAIRAFEVGTGRSLMDLLRSANTGNLNFGDLGIIAAQLIRAGADEKDVVTQSVDPDRIAELMYEEGVALGNARLALCLHDAATGGRTASGEAKVAEATE